MRDLEKVYPFWASLSKVEQDVIEKSVFTEKYNKGMLMHRTEDSCKGLITVLNGQLRTYILSEEGREVKLLLDNDKIIIEKLK